MAQYIDKSALVAEIKSRMKRNQKTLTRDASAAYYEDGFIIDIINSLEVKDMDLESNSFDATVCKIGNTYLKEMDKAAIIKALDSYKDGDKVKVIIIKKE